MNKFQLLFIFRGQDDQIFVVEETEVDRLSSWLLNPDEDLGLFWFSTRDDRSIAVNLKYVQVVRVLWDFEFEILHTAATLDTNDTEVPEQVIVCLRGKSELLNIDSNDYDGIYNFFLNLERSFKISQFPYFDDVDGETVYVNKNELIWASAPGWMIKAGENSFSSHLKTTKAE